MTGLLKAQLMEYEAKEAEAKDAAAAVAARSAMEKIFTEIDNLEEFNRSAGLSQASAGSWLDRLNFSFFSFRIYFIFAPKRTTAERCPTRRLRSTWSSFSVH